jgi:hypothetical protein
MLEEMLKNAKRNARGRRLLTSDQKAVIVQEWEKSGIKLPGIFPPPRSVGWNALPVAERCHARSDTMGIQNEGDLYTRAELEGLRKENEELKKALGRSEPGHQDPKKKVRDGCAKNGSWRGPRAGPGIWGEPEPDHRSVWPVKRGTLLPAERVSRWPEEQERKACGAGVCRCVESAENGRRMGSLGYGGSPSGTTK